MQISLKEATEKLAKSDKLFIELFANGNLSVELYRPDR